MKKIKVFIIEESPFFLRRFSRLIPSLPFIQIIGEVKDPFSALKFLRIAKPDAVIMDMKTQLRFGIDLLKSIRMMTPMPRLIVLTGEQYEAFHQKTFEKVDFLVDKFTDYHLIPEILKWFALQPPLSAFCYSFGSGESEVID